MINGKSYVAGSADLVGVPKDSSDLHLNSTNVYWSCNGKYMGRFEISNKYRPGLKSMISNLKNKFKLHLLSGDNDSERSNLDILFNKNADMLFSQTPDDKLSYVNKLQRKHSRVMMVGDGLNDAGALKQSDCGISKIV